MMPITREEVTLSDDQNLNGMSLLVMENEFVRISILPEKGADIYEFILKATQQDLLWKSPFGVRNTARYVPPGTDTFGSFIELYEGGWQDVFPNGGTPCHYKGAHLGLNGEACTLPWSYRIQDSGPEAASVIFETMTYQTPFRLTKTLSLKRNLPYLTISESITNEAFEPMDFMWGQHLAFDGALLRSGGWQLEVPCATFETNTTSILDPHKKPPGMRINRFPLDGCFEWPIAKGTNRNSINASHFPASDEKCCDILYLKDLRAGWFALINREVNIGFALYWPLEVFPYVWYWQNFHGSFGYPWYGRANVVAIEPFTSYPALGLAEAVARGTQRVLAPGERITAEFKAMAVLAQKDMESLLKFPGGL